MNWRDRNGWIEALAIGLVLLIMVAASKAQDAERIATPSYWTAVSATTSLVAADAVTTLRIPNATERFSPWLYGQHPRPARTVAVMAGEDLFAALAAYELKKHHSRLWAAPLAYMGFVHGRGMIFNLTHN